MIVAVSVHSESRVVERFGHDFPVLLLDFDGQQVRGAQELAPQAGCCGSLAKRLTGAELLICTGLGQGAARHLQASGIAVAMVPEGVAVADALSALAAQTLAAGAAQGSPCRDHEADSSHGCGCGGEHAQAEKKAGCGCHEG